MRKFFVLIFSACLFTNLSSQTPDRDSVKKSEISLNFAPIVALMSGGSPSGHSHFSVDYYRQIDVKLLFHIGISVFPFTGNDQYYYGPQYEKTINDKNIFSTYSYNPELKAQLSLGFEKNFRTRRFVHGLGGDLLMGYQIVHYSSSYTWAFIGDQPFSHLFTGDTTNHQVDSIGYFETSKELSMGLHLFYSVRYKLTKRLNLMLQAGPSLVLVSAQREKKDFASRKTINSQDYYLDFPMPVLTRISLGFTF